MIRHLWPGSYLTSALAATTLLVAACAPQAAPSPTAAPAKPAATTAPAKPTEAPAAKPAATTAPAKPAEAKPAASPAAKTEAKPAEAKPAASPAAKPAEAKPAASPAAKAATFDEKAVGDFYRGKTVKIIVSAGPGAAFDYYARLLARIMPRHIPGEPTIIVENKPGAGGIVSVNAVYNTEAKDGTVIGMPNEYNPLQQVLGAPGVQFDAARLQWLGAVDKPGNGCAVNVSTGVKTLQDIIGPQGREVALGATAVGSSTYDPPAVMNATLGTKFKLIQGYDGLAKMRLASESKEVDGFCVSSDYFYSGGRDLVEGGDAPMKVLVTLGPERHPLLKDAAVALNLAQTEEAKQLLGALHAPTQISRPFAVAPEVPGDRVAALSRALATSLAEPEFRSEAEKSGRLIEPSSAQEATQIVRGILNTPPAIVARLKDILK